MVFKEYEILGLYSTGESLNEDDADILAQITEYTEQPLYLLCGTTFSKEVKVNFTFKIKNLPISIYETAAAYDEKNELYLAWASIDYNIETEDTERISVDNINRLGERNLATSSSKQYKSKKNSCASLLKSSKWYKDAQ
jgi:hypothetical protein